MLSVNSNLAMLFGLLVSTPHAGEVHKALEKGQVERAKSLLTGDPELVQSRDNYRRTPLHLAAGAGRVEVVKALIAAGADVEAQSWDTGWRPLSHAVVAGHEKVVTKLIAAGADVNAKGWTDWGPLEHAAVRARPEVVKILLAAGARVDDDYKWLDEQIEPSTKMRMSPEERRPYVDRLKEVRRLIKAAKAKAGGRSASP